MTTHTTEQVSLTEAEMDAIDYGCCGSGEYGCIADSTRRRQPSGRWVDRKEPERSTLRLAIERIIAARLAEAWEDGHEMCECYGYPGTRHQHNNPYLRDGMGRDQ